MGAWTGKPCANPECGRKKGPRQADMKFCATCQRSNKKARSQAAHGKRVESTYGISEADYWALYEYQGGRCYICRWAQGKVKRLAVDHDHRCLSGHAPDVGCRDCVRGLLCTFCNRLIGKFRDSIEAFERCIEYLTDPPWQRMQRERSKRQVR